MIRQVLPKSFFICAPYSSLEVFVSGGASRSTKSLTVTLSSVTSPSTPAEQYVTIIGGNIETGVFSLTLTLVDIDPNSIWSPIQNTIDNPDSEDMIYRPEMTLAGISPELDPK